jgi:hypothetical protein
MTVTGIAKQFVKDDVVNLRSALEAGALDRAKIDEQKEVRRLFAIDEEKERFTQVRLEAAKLKGDKDLTLDIAAESTDEIYGKLFTFPEPQPSWGTRARDIYIDRTRMVYKPTGILAGLAILTGLITQGIGYLNQAAIERELNAKEERVERTIDGLNAKRNSLEGQIKEFSARQKSLSSTESSEMSNILTFADGQIDQAEGFLGSYSPSKEKVTRENYGEVGKQAANIEETLEQAAKQLEKGRGIITLHDGLVSVRGSLNSLIGEVKSAKPADVFMDRANTAYRSGISAVDNRKLTEAQSYTQQLTELKNAVHEFAVLPAELDKAYQALMNIVRHTPTKNWAEKTYSDGKTYVKNVDISNLKQVTQDLSEKTAVLAQEYEVYAFRQDGARTVWDIEWFETQNGREKITRKDYFIRAQARKNGRVVPVTFYDVGLDKYVTVETFGFRISGDELGRVSDETMLEEFRSWVGAGSYQNEPLAVKAKGYPDEEVKYVSSSVRKVLPFSSKTSLIAHD